MNLEANRVVDGPAVDDAIAAEIRSPRLEGMRPVSRALVWLYLAVACVYLTWRPTTLNPAAPVFSWLLYGAELFGFVTTLLHLFMTWNLTARKPVPAPPGLKVDVLIPTYNEPVDIVRRTLLATSNLQYPCTVWLLDDGNRPEMSALAKELGARYLARADNVHAKAGNLNNALAHCQGEFVAIFDADHAPRQDFLNRTLGYFAAPEVAFVQTPQDFFNIDSYQHRKGGRTRRVWTEQSLFFRVIQRGKDRWNAAFFCGSCAVLRRSALDSIGGFACRSITEDLETSVKLHEAGFRSVYLPEPMAFGLAPSDASSFLRQRIRWGQGAMQVIRHEWLFFRTRLSWAQRMNYIASAITYFDGWQKAIFYLVPAIVLITGTMPIVATASEFLPLFLPFFLLNFVVFEEVGRGYGRTTTIEQYNMARFAAFAYATLALVPRALRFEVTRKDGTSPARKEAGWVTPQAITGAVNLVALVVGLYLYETRQHLPTDGLIANVIWAGINLMLASMIVRFTLSRTRYRRREYRFPLPIPALVSVAGQKVPVMVDNISPAGCRLHGRFPESVQSGSRVHGDLHIPGNPVPFTARVAAMIPAGDYEATGSRTLGLAFEWPDPMHRAELETFLFGSDLQWHLHDLTETVNTPVQVIGRLLTGKGRTKDDLLLEWSTALMPASPDRLLLLRSPANGEGNPMLLSRMPMPLHHIVPISEHGRRAVRQLRIRPIRTAATLMTPTGPLFVTEVETC